MLYQETNDYGVISIDNTFLNQIIKEALKPYEKKAWKAHYKGKTSDFLIKLGNIDALAEQEIKQTEKGIYIKTYLIVKFGSSLGTIAGAVINEIADVLGNDLELEIDDIVVEISGLKMEKGIVKRSVVYSYRQDGSEEQH